MELKANDKFGLDIENGKYKITGVVFTGKVFKRKPNKSGKKTNIVPNTIGYRIEDVATSNSMLVTKDEALYLVSTYGCRNAFVMESDKSKYNSEGECIKEDYRHHLQPFPSTKEAFTQDDRLVNVYKFDDKGEVIIVPDVILNVTEEQCTSSLWELIKEDLKDKEKSRKRNIAKTTNAKEDLSKVRLMKAYNTLKDRLKDKNIGI